MKTVLKTKGLTKQFGGLIATNDVNFELKEGEIKGLIGPNGAGKTTFYNLITGAYRPDSGKVFFMGEDITGMSPYNICRRGLVRTYQITSIFPNLSVFENVRLAAQVGFGKKISFVKNVFKFKNVVDKVSEILGMIGLMYYRNYSAREISQGDQRLLEVAIALALNPKVLLLDEPTAGLSANETMHMVNIIRKLFENSIIKSIVIVEHDLEVVLDLAHSICVLNYGEVVKDGPTREVCDDPKVQEVYLAGGKINATGS